MNHRVIESYIERLIPYGWEYFFQESFEYPPYNTSIKKVVTSITYAKKEAQELRSFCSEFLLDRCVQKLTNEYIKSFLQYPLYVYYIPDIGWISEYPAVSITASRSPLLHVSIIQNESLSIVVSSLISVMNSTQQTIDGNFSTEWDMFHNTITGHTLLNL